MRWMMTMILSVGLTSMVLAADVKYVLTKDNPKIEWTGTKPGGKHSGGFEKVNGTASITEAAGLKIDVEIDCVAVVDSE